MGGGRPAVRSATGARRGASGLSVGPVHKTRGVCLLSRALSSRASLIPVVDVRGDRVEGFGPPPWGSEDPPGPGPVGGKDLHSRLGSLT